MNASNELDLSKRDVRLCLENVQRLMRDSNKVSAESKLMLRELALEELAKGYMVFFRLLAKNPSEVRGRLRFPKTAGSEKLAELLEGHRDMFSEAALRRAFKDHEVKVEFLGALSDVLLQTPPILLDDRNVDSQGLPFAVVYRLAKGRVKRLTQLGDASNRRTIAKIRERANRQVDGRLDNLAKRATYVDLRTDGPGCIPPVADPELSDALRHFNRPWSGALDLAIQIFLRS